MTNNSKKIIMIADSHLLQGSQKTAEFFEMLSVIDESAYDIVLLGDIFDFWIAIPGYEDESHVKFSEWCKKRKNKSTVGFIEGNHEFFVSEGRKDSFSWSSSAPFYVDNSLAFAHGDCINTRDWRYLLLRRLVKNKLARFLMMNVPFGRKITIWCRERLRNSNPENRKQIPEQEIANFAKNIFAAGAGRIFVGHFHKSYEYSDGKGNELLIVPQWSSSGEIAVYDREKGTFKVQPWRECDLHL